MVAVALLACLVTSPALALNASDVEQMAKSVGCTASIEEYQDDTNPVNAGYFPWQRAIKILNFHLIPESWQRMIAWHEIGHCLQFQNEEFNEDPGDIPYNVEWDADEFAIKQMAKERVDGTSILRDFFHWLYLRYGVTGRADESHGTTVDRITRAIQRQVIINRQS